MNLWQASVSSVTHDVLPRAVQNRRGGECTDISLHTLLDVYQLRNQSHVWQANQNCLLCLLLFDSSERSVYKIVEAYGLFFSLYNTCVDLRKNFFLHLKLVLILYPLKSVGFLLLFSEHVAACMKIKCLFKTNILQLSLSVMSHCLSFL